MITQGVLWSGGSPRPGEFPDSGRFHHHIEMECFVYNWRILLGGAASAAILAVGVAAPAFAQAQDAPVSLSGLNSASGVLFGEEPGRSTPPNHPRSGSSTGLGPGHAPPEGGPRSPPD